MIQQLKERFVSCELSSQKVQVLTVLPKSWSIRKIEQEFSASNPNPIITTDLLRFYTALAVR